MNTNHTRLIDRSGFEDVYSALPPDHRDEPVVSEVELCVLLESYPGALSRLFALLCLFELVPARANSVTLSDGVIRQVFWFTRLSEKRLSLLVGKVSQLTECIEVEVNSSSA